MDRRTFLATGLAGVAAAGKLAATARAQQAEGAKVSGKHAFKLKYAPHFGMFQNHAGPDLTDQLKFAADQGFTALEDNGMMGRAPDEQPDTDLERWYRALLGALRDPAFRSGRWQLCERSGWPGNDRWSQLVAWCWEGAAPDATPDATTDAVHRWLAIVNLGPEPAAGHVTVPSSWGALRGETVRLVDPVHDTTFDRSGQDLLDGLYVQLDPWGSHLFSIRPATRGLDPGEEP